MKSSSINAGVSLRYQTGSSVSAAYGEPDDYILPVTAEIVGSVELGDSAPRQREIILGTLKFYLIRVGNAVDDGADLYEVFDSYHETLQASAAVFDVSSWDFRPEVEKRFEDAFSGGDIPPAAFLCAQSKRNSTHGRRPWRVG